MLQETRLIRSIQQSFKNKWWFTDVRTTAKLARRWKNPKKNFSIKSSHRKRSCCWCETLSGFVSVVAGSCSSLAPCQTLDFRSRVCSPSCPSMTDTSNESAGHICHMFQQKLTTVAVYHGNETWKQELQPRTCSFRNDYNYCVTPGWMAPKAAQIFLHVGLLKL